jgi:hypothetical protein
LGIKIGVETGSPTELDASIIVNCVSPRVEMRRV